MSNRILHGIIGVAALAVLTAACGSQDAATPSTAAASTASTAASSGPSTVSSTASPTAPTSTQEDSATVSSTPLSSTPSSSTPLSSTPNPTGNPLQGTTWELVSTTAGTADPEMVDPEIGATLMISGTRLQVKTGCNSGSGSITVMGDAFHVDPLATTRMACDPERTKLETIQLAVLTDQVSYQIAGDQLTLTNGAGTLVYQAGPAGAPESSDGEPVPATPMPTAGPSGTLASMTIPVKSSMQVSIPENPNSPTK